jgi:hypothetical protein
MQAKGLGVEMGRPKISIADLAHRPLTPSPGIPGEGRGEGELERRTINGKPNQGRGEGELERRTINGKPNQGRGEGELERRTIPDIPNHPHPNPLPAYRERGQDLRPSRSKAIVLTIVIAWLTPSAFAQDWSITTADFRTRPATLLGLSSDDVKIQFPGQPEGSTVSIDDFVSLQRISPQSSAAEKFTLILRGGDRLTGRPLKVLDEQLLWQSNSLGEISIPLTRLLALGRGGDASFPAESPKQDVVTLANGDTVAGVFTDCSDQKVSIQTDSGVSDVPLSSVNKILFASTGFSTSSAGHAFRIRLTDGSSATATEVTLAGNQLSFTIDAKPARKIQTPVDQVQEIEQLNGPISWLSSRTPVMNEQVPYFAGSQIWPARMDIAVDGSPLRFGSQSFDHGIGVHAYSHLTYAIDSGWKSFRTQYSIDSSEESPRPLADVTVRIKLDGKTVHEESHVRAGALSPVVWIDLNGAKTLELEADYGNAGDTQDHLNWIEPALVREGH